jgi:hypothetical protein
VNVDRLLQHARDLPVEAVAALGAVAAFLVVLAIGVSLAAARLRRQLDQAEEELVDAETGLLPRSAVRVRLGAELAWASTTRVPLAVAVLRIRGSRFTAAARVLRSSMREEESAFLLRDQRVAVELWGADADDASIATRRLGEDLARAGHPVVDAGVACAPRDGSDVETLLAAAQRDLRPIDDPRQPGLGSSPLATLARVLPSFAALGLVLLVAWRLVPAAIEPILHGGSRSSRDLAVALVAVIGIPLGAALAHVACWNFAGGAAPRSHPLRSAGLRVGAAIAVIVAAPLAWGVFRPEAPSSLSLGFGATLAVLALIVFALLHARQLVHVPPVLLLVLAVLGGAITWLATDPATLPVVADAGRLLLAASLGALLASLVERASWMVGLALLAGAVDVWSVFADQGVTNRLLDTAAAGNDHWLRLLLVTGPSVDGTPLFGLGVTDLVFLALFLSWSHDWRLDMRVVTAALLVATWAGMLTSELGPDVVPLLPFLAAAMTLVLLGRSLVLRARARAWRSPDPGPRSGH